MKQDTSCFNELIRLAISSLYYVLITDANGYIAYLSDNYATLLDVDPDEAIGKYVSDVIPSSRMHLVAKSGKEEIGSLFKLKNGLTIVCNRIPIKKDGKVVGVISNATFENLNAVKILNKEIETLKNENTFYKKELEELRKTKYSITEVVGDSEPIIKIKDIIKKVADSSLSVLITGETGTGKEVFANAIHQLSNRRTNNFVKINCAAIPKELMESELFGYEAGAFSGASKNGKIGKFELANKGTILLDEIGEMPLFLQSKLLRVIQERELQRVGGLNTIKLDVRIICNTNRNIEEQVEKGLFREDLYYRINVVELNIPSLRERFEDIPLLCDFFIKKINAENGINIAGIKSDVIKFFQKYTWPGNVRELEHALERASIMAGSGELRIDHFDFLISRFLKNSRKNNRNLHEDILDKVIPLEEKKIIVEKEEILKALSAAKGNKTVAAKMLDIDRTVLYSKLKKYEIL